jgi:O-acetyl-ADP-ribose deacetylase (regulator of RNase III)
METSLRNKIEIFCGAITKLKADAIVNAANSSLIENDETAQGK